MSSMQVFDTWTGDHVQGLTGHFEAVTDVAVHPYLPVSPHAEWCEKRCLSGGG